MDITAAETVWLRFTRASRYSWWFSSNRSQLAAQQTLLERKSGDELGSASRDQQLFFELDPLQSIHFTDVAFDAHDHSRLEDPLPAEPGEILRMCNERRFAMHADSMQDGRVATLHEPVRDLPGERRQLAVADAGPDDPYVVLYLIIGVPV